jgi:hypothetical protein
MKSNRQNIVNMLRENRIRTLFAQFLAMRGYKKRKILLQKTQRIFTKKYKNSNIFAIFVFSLCYLRLKTFIITSCLTGLTNKKHSDLTLIINKSECNFNVSP